MSETMKIGVVGLGGRGYGLVKWAILPACEDYNVEIAAVYDPYEDRTERAAQLVFEKTGKRPLAAKSYQEILDDPEIKGIITPSAWEAHVDVAVAAMRAGKYAAMEVGGAYTIEDCWKLVDAYEETGIPCMLLENCCYGQRELMILNMVRMGLLGDVVHCSGGYMHDLREEIANGKENRHYRLRNYMNRNCENYPTHELGPIAKLLDINNGNRMVSLTATSSCSKGLHEYIVAKKGASNPLAKVNFAQGDVFTTVIKCARGQTIVLTLDTTLPRAYSRGFTIRGTKGAYFEDTDSIFLDSKHHKYEFDGRGLWGNAKKFEKKYNHELWRDYDPKGGHGGMDYLVISAFLEAMTTGKNPPIDVYDAAAYMAITALSEESVIKGSAPVMIPDFTRGKWYRRNDIDHDLKYDLSRADVNKEIYD